MTIAAAVPQTHRWPVLRLITASLAAGFVSGLVIGGLLGRAAMRLLALTSPPIAQGRLTDDGARVGEFTLTGSAVLAVSLGVAGLVLLGVSYPLARRVLPASRRGRVAGFALLTGSVGGALLVHGYGSFDYTILQPTWLAVTLFLLVPTAAGASTAFLAEAWGTSAATVRRTWLSRAWRSRAVTLLGLSLYWLLVAWGGYNIAADIVSMATERTLAWPLLA